MDKPIVIVRAIQTSMACPSQWDLYEQDGSYLYARYRHGCGEVRRYATARWYESDEDQFLGTVAEFCHGDPLDGHITLEEFAALAGLVLADTIVTDDFATHLHDQLVMDGALGLDPDEAG